ARSAWAPRCRACCGCRPPAGAAADRYRPLQGLQRPLRPHCRDKMLKRIVLDIMAAARMSDLTYRFGGEEFVVIADGINAEDALSLGERIRRRIADSHADSADGLTVGVGIASCSRDASDYDTLFEIADKRLYEAKAAGRNRVVGPEKSVRLIQAR